MRKITKIFVMLLVAFIVINFFETDLVKADVVKIGKPKISVTAYGGSAEIAVNTLKNAERYQIYMKGPEDKKYKLVYTIVGEAKKNTKTILTAISGLQAGAYSFKARGVNGKTKGKFSKVKKVEINAGINVLGVKNYKWVSTSYKDSAGKVRTVTADNSDAVVGMVLDDNGTGYVCNSNNDAPVRAFVWNDSKLKSIGDENTYSLKIENDSLILSNDSIQSNYVLVSKGMDQYTYSNMVSKAFSEHRTFEEKYTGQLDYEMYNMVREVMFICFVQKDLFQKVYNSNHVYRVIITSSGIKVLYDGKKVKDDDEFFTALEETGFSYIKYVCKCSKWQEDYILECGSDLDVRRIKEPIIPGIYQEK